MPLFDDRQLGFQRAVFFQDNCNVGQAFLPEKFVESTRPVAACRFGVCFHDQQIGHDIWGEVGFFDDRQAGFGRQLAGGDGGSFYRFRCRYLTTGDPDTSPPCFSTKAMMSAKPFCRKRSVKT